MAKDHHATVQNPGQFKTVERVNDKFGSGIDAIMGKRLPIHQRNYKQ